MLIKNRIYETDILRYGCNGEGIAEIEGMVVFIPYTLLGEHIEVKIVKVQKNYAYGRLMRIIKASPCRTVPKCPVYFKCGGCALLHSEYANQLEIKKEIIKASLRNICERDFTVHPSEQFGYRNKLQIPVQSVDGKPECGFYRENSHDITPVNECLLQTGVSRKIISAVKEYMSECGVSAYDEKTGRGMVRHVVAREFGGGVAVVVVINGKALPEPETLIGILKNNFRDFSLFVNINTNRNNVVCSENYIKLYGSDVLKGELNGIKLEISPQSFLQVNSGVASALYNAAAKHVKGGIVIDAYSGIGVLSMMLAKQAKYVFGVEIIPEATENANRLAEINGIANVCNLTGDCAEIIPELTAAVNAAKYGEKTPFPLPQNFNPQPGDKVVFVADPPRKGLAEEVIAAVKKIKADSIVYISCNPATLARDLKMLSPQYTLNRLSAYDMFPNTKHCEVLAVLKREK